MPEPHREPFDTKALEDLIDWCGDIIAEATEHHARISGTEPTVDLTQNEVRLFGALDTIRTRATTARRLAASIALQKKEELDAIVQS